MQSGIKVVIGGDLCVASVRSAEEAERVVQALRCYARPVAHGDEPLPLEAFWYDEAVGVQDTRVAEEAHPGDATAAYCAVLAQPEASLEERLRRSVEAQAAVRREMEELSRTRAKAAAELHEQGATFAAIATFAGVSRARAQQLVEQGRALRDPAR